MAPDESFATSTRAVAPLVGFILLFGLFTVAFAGYQATSVPQQNAETEFQHYEAVQNDLIVVRNAISRAGQQNQSQFESVQLGTRYRERILALNPPAPAGTLRTSDAYNITIKQDGTPITASPIPTRFLEYQNGYNELEIAPIRYENSVLYLNDPEGNESVVFENQNLVRDDGTVVLTALQNSFDRSATGRVTVELYPTTSAPQTLPEGELNVTIPTQLSADYWNTALAETDLAGEDYSVQSASVAYPKNDDVRALEIRVTTDDLTFNTVGIDSPPESNTAPTTGTDGGGSIDEAPLDYVELEGGTDGDVEFLARSTADSIVTVTGFRIDATALSGNPRLSVDGEEVVIEPKDDGIRGSAERPAGTGNNNGYSADGTSYSLDNQATINSNEEVTISFFGLRQGNNRLDFDLERTGNPDNADVIVTLEYDSFDPQSFYFEDTS